MSQYVEEVMRYAKSDTVAYIDPLEVEAWRLPEKSPSTIVAEKLVLPSDANVYTSIDLDMTPYLKFPVECIGDSRFFLLGIIGPTQGGKSTFLQIAVADMIDQAPGTGLYVLPDNKQGKRQLDQKVIKPLKLTPCLSRHIVQPESKTITQEAIYLDNMTLYLGWSNSPSSLSSTPCTRVFLDEARLFKKELGQESNPVMLSLDRLTVAREAGFAQGYLVTTPSDEGDLSFQQLQVPNTTVLYWYWKCPNCGKYMVPDFFEMVRRPKLNEDGHEIGPATCHCKYCEHEFSDRNQKRSINCNGAYGYAGQDGQTSIELGTLTDRLFFRFDSMSSPFRPFDMIWREFVRTKKHTNDYRNFWQCWLARYWKLSQSSLTATDLAGRKGDYLIGTVPYGTLVLTAGIDTQDDGFYVVVRAWGADRQTWIIDNFFMSARIEEMPAKELAARFRAQIEDRIYKMEDGTPWKIAHYAIDTGGHRTKEIYNVNEHLDNMILIKGRDSQQETITYSVNRFMLYMVRTSVYLEETETACGKPYWHLPKDISPDFLEQWVSAKKQITLNKKTNMSTVVWVKEKQNDYRYADVHSYIAVDIPWDGTTLRRCLEQPNWSYNPVVARIAAEALSREDHKTNQELPSYDDAPFSEKHTGFSFSFN